MKKAELVEKMLAHYRGKLAEERKRFGILGVSTCYVDHNSQQVYDQDTGAGHLWADLAEQSGMEFYVGTLDDPQLVYAVLSLEPIPRPDQVAELHDMICDLDDQDHLEIIYRSLDYEGPYKYEFNLEDVEDLEGEDLEDVEDAEL